MSTLTHLVNSVMGLSTLLGQLTLTGTSLLLISETMLINRETPEPEDL